MGPFTDAYGMPRRPRAVVLGLASCFGCQLQITNMESHLLDVLGQIDLGYWQLTSSAALPDSFDVAVIEGAVTTEESAQVVRLARERASVVVAVGACAVTGGVPGMAAPGFAERMDDVYGAAGAPAACGVMTAPLPVSALVPVDFEVRCCPIDPLDFVRVLHQALLGSNVADPVRTMCGDCKLNESDCFYTRGTLCLGLVTRAACGARCVNLGRPCNGCAGLSPDANLASARRACERAGIPVRAFDEALQMFNQVDPALAPADAQQRAAL